MHEHDLILDTLYVRHSFLEILRVFLPRIVQNQILILDDLKFVLSYISPPFHKKKRPSLPNEDDIYTLEEEGFALLERHNLKRYEISAFSQPNKSARHNLNYWLFGDYFGIGAGAHGKLTTKDTKQIFRTRKQRQPTDYLNLNKPFLAAIDEVSKAELIFEFMLNTTRLQQAIPKTLFTERTGLGFDRLAPGLLKAQTKGLLNINAQDWQITPFGRRYTNDLQAIFLPE